MKPLNASDRKNALWSFILYYAISIALVVTVVFFGMQVPFRQNDLLKTHITQFQKQRQFMETFSSKMIDAQNLLDSVNRPGVASDLIDGQIADVLTKMNSMIVSDTTIPKAIYTGIVGNFSNLKDAKGQLRNAGNNDAIINTLRQQLSDYQNKLAQANLTIATLSQGVR
ncbi:MAG TPA: type VI secretion system TssO [Arachidicoccus sp.]|nr:type VI secretion system TssO [Arachidicoccus sp.]